MSPSKKKDSEQRSNSNQPYLQQQKNTQWKLHQQDKREQERPNRKGKEDGWTLTTPTDMGLRPTEKKGEDNKQHNTQGVRRSKRQRKCGKEKGEQNQSQATPNTTNTPPTTLPYHHTHTHTVSDCMRESLMWNIYQYSEHITHKLQQGTSICLRHCPNLSPNNTQTYMFFLLYLLEELGCKRSKAPSHTGVGSAWLLHPPFLFSSSLSASVPTCNGPPYHPGPYFDYHREPSEPVW